MEELAFTKYPCRESFTSDDFRAFLTLRHGVVLYVAYGDDGRARELLPLDLLDVKQCEGGLILLADGRVLTGDRTEGWRQVPLPGRVERLAWIMMSEYGALLENGDLYQFDRLEPDTSIMKAESNVRCAGSNLVLLEDGRSRILSSDSWYEGEIIDGCDSFFLLESGELRGRYSHRLVVLPQVKELTTPHVLPGLAVLEDGSLYILTPEPQRVLLPAPVRGVSHFGKDVALTLETGEVYNYRNYDKLRLIRTSRKVAYTILWFDSPCVMYLFVFEDGERKWGEWRGLEQEP